MKRNLRLISSLLAILMLMLSVTGCSNSAYQDAPAADTATDSVATQAPEEAPEPTADSITLRMATATPDDDTNPVTIAMKAFEQKVEADSNGSIQVDIFYNNALGSLGQIADSLVAGSVEMGVVGTEIAQRIPEVAAFEAPFLFKDWAHVETVLNTDYVKDIYSVFPEEHGIRQLAFVPQGFRVILSTKPLSSMADFEGLRLRVPEIALYTAIGSGLGANPIAMALSELFTAIEADSVDALENTYGYLYSAKYYEITDYLLESNHNFVVHSLYINEGVYQELSAEQQTVLSEAAVMFQEEVIDANVGFEDVARQTMIDSGVEITVPDDAFRAEMVASQDEAYAVFYETYPGTEDIIAEVKTIE